MPRPTTRRTVEQRSAPVLMRLTALPRWLPAAVMGVLLVGGLLLGGWAGAVLLLALAAYVGWLGYLSWPLATTGGRVLRLLVVLVLAGAGVSAALR